MARVVERDEEVVGPRLLVVDDFPYGLLRRLRTHEGIGNATSHDVHTCRHLDILRRRREAKNRTLLAKKRYNSAVRGQGPEPSTYRE